jgi:hypothetical protein
MSNTKKIKPVTKDRGNIILAWCDNGTTDGKFTEGLLYTALTSQVPIASAMRVQGNQIGRQRQNALDYWYDHTDFEWILWVDSDIELTSDVLQMLWDTADATARPIVSGMYFVSKENEQSLMTPYPALFSWTDDPYQISYVHPVPENVVLKIGAAGFGLLLMNRSVVKQMREKHGNVPFFNETGVGEKFVSEDINFFKLMRDADVPLFAHTGAHVKHMKRFAFDLEFYKLFWSMKFMEEEAKNAK